MAGSRKGINSKEKQDTEFLAKFGNLYEAYHRGEVTKKQMAEELGITWPTLKKHEESWYIQCMEAIGRGEIVRG